MKAADAPLLMIPGPIEVSPAVRSRFSEPTPSHVAPALIEAFGASLQRMREIWMAGDDSQPFVVAGGGTLAMEMSVANIVEPEDRVVVVNTGFFSSRLTAMLRRAGAEVREISAAIGEAPSPEQVRHGMDELGRAGKIKALFATHVDTSTGVLLDPAPLIRLAREHDALTVVDGVCATAAERFEMAAWDADVYLTASQKALGLPPGLALMVASPRALAARSRRQSPAPPLYLDWESWLPIMRAYEERKPSYFSTPATNLILALEVGLGEILAAGGLEARIALHRRCAGAMRAAWQSLGLESVPRSEERLAHTLSAIFYPKGVDAALLARIAKRGVIVAAGLHPEIRDRYFRVGHMGYAATRPELLTRTVRAIAESLDDAAGRPPDDGRVAVALRALESRL